MGNVNSICLAILLKDIHGMYIMKYHIQLYHVQWYCLGQRVVMDTLLMSQLRS